MTVCMYCADTLELETRGANFAWVDSTEGDCCSGNDQLLNEGRPHIPTRETVIGSRIKLWDMPNDPAPITAGSKGTVTNIVGGLIPQVQVDWDSGRNLCLIPGTDVWEALT